MKQSLKEVLNISLSKKDFEKLKMISEILFLGEGSILGRIYILNGIMEFLEARENATNDKELFEAFKEPSVFASKTHTPTKADVIFSKYWINFSEKEKEKIIGFCLKNKEKGGIKDE